MARSLLVGRLDRVGVGGTGIDAALFGATAAPTLPGRGGNGIAGGGDGNDATDADFRRWDAAELERPGLLPSSTSWTSWNLACEVVSRFKEGLMISLT